MGSKSFAFELLEHCFSEFNNWEA